MRPPRYRSDRFPADLAEGRANQNRHCLTCIGQMTTVAYLNTNQIVQRTISIGHSDRRHLEFSDNYRKTETLIYII